MDLIEMGKAANKAKTALAKLSQSKKNECLLAIADALLVNQAEIIKANDKDVENAKNAGTKESLIDRLRLTEARFDGMAEGIKQIVSLDDPIGEVLYMKERPNGLQIGERRIPLGVIGIIYESRPNVTVDAFSLCFKTGNAVILRGGSDAIHSNMALVKVISDTLEANGVTGNSVQLLTDTSREVATEMMKLNQYIDVLIPRGGAGLIQSVVKNATVSVIETGTGNCHIYVDKSADVNMAVPIIENAKMQRLGVCNACESLVIHKEIADAVLPEIIAVLKKNDCEIRGDETVQTYDNAVIAATEEDYGTEYLDAIISIKVVADLEEAIAHVNTYSTGHSESIITSDYNASMRFLNEIDSAAVYVNASTRFTDGFEFGFGAEIGISTQKLHARGPMGLKALTTTKFIILGEGQIR